jgi:hypothetical protein
MPIHFQFRMVTKAGSERLRIPLSAAVVDWDVEHQLLCNRKSAWTDLIHGNAGCVTMRHGGGLLHLLEAAGISAGSDYLGDNVERIGEAGGSRRQADGENRDR